VNSTERYENGGFPPFFTIGTGSAELLAWLRDGPDAKFRRLTMTLSLTLQHAMLSVIGALLASSLFISAAVGQVPII
jgi:hypothetical protein